MVKIWLKWNIVQMMEEDLASMTQDLIDDLQEAISSGRVTDGKLKRIFKQHNIKFDLLEFLGISDIMAKHT